MGVLQGGKFGHGFVTAGLNESLSGKIGRIGSPGGQIAASAILGGTTSSLVGGKFANGAITAAFATAFNEAVHGSGRSGRARRAHRALNELDDSLSRRVYETATDAAHDFCFSGGCKITERYGFEVGANINQVSTGFRLADFQLGTESNVDVAPSFADTVAEVHVHPFGGAEGFSGGAVFANGELRTSYGGDIYGYLNRKIDGFVFRSGSRSGLYFDQSSFRTATYRAAATDTFSDKDFTKGVR